MGHILFQQSMKFNNIIPVILKIVSWYALYEEVIEWEKVLIDGKYRISKQVI